MVRHALTVGMVAGFVVVASAAQNTPTPATQSPGDLAQALQTKYDTVRDFSADFVHTYQGGVLRKSATERGSLLVKKPGKMRWTYKWPEEKLFVSNGVKMFSYVPLDNQVIVTDVPVEDEATASVLFLAGKGNLTRDFSASYGEESEAPAGSSVLKLVPRKPDREYQSLTIVLDARLRILMLVTLDAQGGRSAFAFSNFKENRGLSDKEFNFSIPRGADVITDGRPSL